MDEARARDLRAILHDPRFRGIEAAWRSLDLLVRRARDESIRDLLSRRVARRPPRRPREPRRSSRSHGPVPAPRDRDRRHPGRRAVGRRPRALRLRPDDRRRRVPRSRREGRPGRGRTLPRGRAPGARRLRVARGDAGSGWLEACPKMAGRSSGRSCAPCPRPPGSPSRCRASCCAFLMAATTDPIDSFPFEEIPGLPEPEDYLWGNGALACALVLGSAFERDGWDLRPETGGGDPGSARARLQGRARDPRHAAVRSRPDGSRGGEDPRGGARPRPVAQRQRERARRAAAGDREPAACARGTLAE